MNAPVSDPRPAQTVLATRPLPIGRTLTIAVIFCWAAILAPELLDQRNQSRIYHCSWWVFALAYLACFLVMRPAMDRPREGHGRVATFVMVACGIAATLLTPDDALSPVFLCVTAALCGFTLTAGEVKVVVALQWVTIAVGVVHGNVQGQWATIFAAMVAFAAIVVQSTVREIYARQVIDRTMVELGAAHEQLQEAHQELAAAQAALSERSRAEERLRIATDLHDSIGHQLTALSLNLEVIAHRAPAELAERIELTREMAKDVLTDIRAVVLRLRGPEVNLREDLEAMIRGIASPRVEVDIDDAIDQCHRATRAVAFRVAQEGLTNVMRHSGATQAHVTLAIDGDDVFVDVRDNGVGSATVQPGSGLQGMRERVTSIGGSVEWSSAPGVGFRVTARLPVLP